MFFDIFMLMKKLLFILSFLPLVAIGQYDFETRYLKIDADVLPEVSGLTELPFGNNAVFSNKLPTLQITPENYWQSVDMAAAVAQTQNYSNRQLSIPAIKSRTFGFSVQMLDRNSFDGTSNKGLRNIAYKEQRSYYFCGLTGIPVANQ